MSGIESAPALAGFAAAPVQAVPDGLFKALPAVAVAAAIWYIELRSRGDRTPSTASVPEYGKILRGHVYEVAGLVACMALAAAMLLRGDTWVPTDPADAEAWNKIKAAWPLLTTADSLIALQAMLRVPPLASALLRPSHSCPLAGGPALLGFGASACRVALLALSPYHRLDGPLSGGLHASFEVAALAALLLLSRGAFQRRRQVFALAAVALTTAWVAYSHRLAFAEDSPRLDALLTLAELMELAAASLYLARTFGAAEQPHGGASGLLRAVLPVQQGLSMYYWLLAFEDEPGLSAAGQPLALMRVSSTAQVGMYLAAAVLHLCLSAEASAS
mmetsp:Transcript_125758/g.367514  ORF Transcript_125758/g.367514 Transcript_125758/m.367514 type:complete len:332 (-) Transcript_125758:71-1066(-)